MKNTIVKTIINVTKALEDERALIVTISTINPDRSKDIVQPRGVVLDNYLKNPVVGVGHNYAGLSIAKTVEIETSDTDIQAKIVFPEKGVYDLADTIYELYKGGFMNTWSIGFMPIEFKELATGGREFIKWELYEFSAVFVPDNPEAITVMRSKAKNIDLEPLEKVLSDEKAVKKTVKKEEEKTEKIEADKKDVRETVALAEIIDYLNYLTANFERNEVKEEVLNKMKAALELLMEALKMEAVIGQKGFTPENEEVIENIEVDSKTSEVILHIKDQQTKKIFKGNESVMTFLKELFDAYTQIKEGRVLSDSNRKKVQSAVDQMGTATKALTDLMEATEKQTQKSNQPLKVDTKVEALKLIDKIVGTTLRDLKSKSAGKIPQSGR